MHFESRDLFKKLACIDKLLVFWIGEYSYESTEEQLIKRAKELAQDGLKVWKRIEANPTIHRLEDLAKAEFAEPSPALATSKPPSIPEMIAED
ncbi:hypothetical protein HHI36_014145 [Cryptolaemus montrouzieri]|uniref:Uncharacterized protein n=1 Tax=Cryptolaemus montrouzieri TaxID=559131 RepID=A0ABD2N2W7_9CUCU